MNTNTTTNKVVGNGMEAGREAFQHASERIDDATRDFRKNAAEGVKQAAAQGRVYANEAIDVAEDFARTAGRYVREKPVQAALIGIGGLVLASLLLRRR